jgi:hypothetical protein
MVFFVSSAFSTLQKGMDHLYVVVCIHIFNKFQCLLQNIEEL